MDLALRSDYSKISGCRGGKKLITPPKYVEICFSEQSTYDISKFHLYWLAISHSHKGL